MDTTVLIVIFSILCLTFLILGGIIGWLAQQNNYVNMQNQGAFATHPEMYDENGMMINEQLLSVKFINEDEIDETLDA